MEIYRIELSRISKIYELVTYKVVKTTEASFLCEERGFTRRIRIPKYDTLHMTFTDRTAGLLKLTQMLESLRITKLETAERALEAYEEACAELRGERVLGTSRSCGWMGAVVRSTRTT